MIRLTWVALFAAMLAGCQSMTGGGGGAEPTIESTELRGEAGEPRNRAKIHTELASLYYQRRNYPVALEELRIATAADANYAPAYSLYGLLYMDLKENQLAQTNFERALRLSPTDPDINHNFGLFLCQTGRENDSLKYFMQAVRNPLYPTPWRSYSTAGVCAMRKDNLKDAEGYFIQALRQEPNDPNSLLALGQIRYRQGNLEEARRLVGRYNRLVDPTSESLWLALRIERKAGERVAESSFSNQLRRRFQTSREYQLLQRGEYD
jgi:type IV pilus assembly protein PilF